MATLRCVGSGRASVLHLGSPLQLCHRLGLLPCISGHIRRSKLRCPHAAGIRAQLDNNKDPLLFELPSPLPSIDPDPGLSNNDLIPTAPQQRTFSALDILSLWLGLVIGVPSYYLAGSLVDLGMAWWQGILIVIAGNFLLLFPLVLTGHAGVKYGIPFPVLARASFGIYGAHIPTILRGLVACGWFGIETWIGGQSIHLLLQSLVKQNLIGYNTTWLGTPLSEWACFFFFWFLQLGIILKGVNSINRFEKYCAPVLFVLSLMLLVWAYVNAGGFGAMLAVSSQFGVGGAKQGKFWQVFFPALTANIGFWATLSLNITDFTRYAKSQSDQIVGHMGLPIFMGLFTFLGLAVTSSTEVIFGSIISSPIELLARIDGVVPVFLSLIGLTLATLTTNIAANVMAPTNALINMNPNLFTFRTGALTTAVLGILFGPWQFMKNSESFISTWLVGYSALLGPLSGIIVVDYHVIRRRQLELDALYSKSPSGIYWYTNGYNLYAIAAFLLAVAPCIPGFLLNVGLLRHVPRILVIVYDNAWIFGFLTAGFLYWVMFAFRKSARNR